MYVLPFVQPFIIRYTFDFLKYFSLGLILGAKWNGGRGFPVQFAVLLAGDSPFSVLVSDPVLKAVPAPNTVPSAVSRERRSCDALNRWVRRQLWASSTPGWLGWRMITSGKPGPRREPCVKALGFVLRFCS